MARREEEKERAEDAEGIVEEESPQEEPRYGNTDAGSELELSAYSRGSESLPAHLQETIRAAREYAEAARADNTIRAYSSDLEDFRTYCHTELGGESHLPAHPEVVALYIADMAKERELATSTIQRRLASISAAHKRAGHTSPTEERVVRETMKGVRRKKGSAQKQAAPITVPVLERVMNLN